MTAQTYKLQRYGKLLTLKAVMPNLNGDYQGIRLLVDTGATYTTLPIRFLEELGYVISDSTKRVSISTANGLTQAPTLEINRFNCLGQSIENFSVLALNLPTNAVISGLLGMDFLECYGAVIDTKKAEITIPQSTEL
jgi:clan AA aspartic protease (TIGR02281 family)